MNRGGGGSPQVAPDRPAISRTGKDARVQLWISRNMSTQFLFKADREFLLDIRGIDPGRPPTSRRWFGGTAPLLPLTDPTPTRHDLGRVLARLLIAAVVTQGNDQDNCVRYVLRALSACEFSLRQLVPYDVVELAEAVSEDDDQLIVIVDAVIRLRKELLQWSPLHPTRLVFQILSTSRFDHQFLVDLMMDKDTGVTGAFTMVFRILEWAKTWRDLLVEVAHDWVTRMRTPGGWTTKKIEYDYGEEDEDEEEDEEEEEVEEKKVERVKDASEEERKDGEKKDEVARSLSQPPNAPPVVDEQQPKWNRLRREDAAVAAQIAAMGEEGLVEDGEEEEEEGGEGEGKPAAWMIRVDVMAGNMNEEKEFIFPPKDKEYQIVLPSQAEEKEDAWPPFVEMISHLRGVLIRSIRKKDCDFGNKQACRDLLIGVRAFLANEAGEAKLDAKRKADKEADARRKAEMKRTESAESTESSTISTDSVGEGGGERREEGEEMQMVVEEKDGQSPKRNLKRKGEKEDGTPTKKGEREARESRPPIDDDDQPGPSGVRY